MKKQRQPGQYWVQYEMGEWQVAKWVPAHGWYLQDHTTILEDTYLYKIDETPITRRSAAEPKEGRYENVSSRVYSATAQGDRTLSSEEMMAIGINRFTELMGDLISQGDGAREATLQLSYQVERIANALEKPRIPQKQEGVTGPALELAKELVESWEKPKFKQYSWNTGLIDLRLLWEHCGNRERFLDAIAQKLEASGSVFGKIKPLIHLPELWKECENNQDKFMAKLRELGLQDSIFAVHPIIEVVKVIKHQRFRDGGTIEYRDIRNRRYIVPAPVYKKSGIYNSANHIAWNKEDQIKDVQLRVVASFSSAEVEGEPSLYESPAVQRAYVDPAHPDFKEDLGAGRTGRKDSSSL